MLKPLVISLSLMFASCSMALGQATTTASRSDFEIGGTYSFVYPDYTPQKANAFGAYTNYFLTPHFGVELDFHRASINQHSPETETSFEYGLAYRRVIGPARPYFRASLGRGAFNFAALDGSQTSVADLSYNMYVIAGGMDYEVTRMINVRGEIEYQSWFANPGLTNGLTPVMFTVGAAFHFNPKEPNY